MAFDVLMHHAGAGRLHNGRIFGLDSFSAPVRPLWTGAEIDPRARSETSGLTFRSGRCARCRPSARASVLAPSGQTLARVSRSAIAAHFDECDCDRLAFASLE
jgi:hypothetical protein